MSASIEEINGRLVELKAEGVWPVKAIKAIYEEFDLSLADAKRHFSLSPAWQLEAAAGDRLHQEILEALGRDSEL